MRAQSIAILEGAFLRCYLKIHRGLEFNIDISAYLCLAFVTSSLLS